MIKSYMVFFKNLYSDPGVVGLGLDGLTFKYIDDRIREWLERPFMKEEVEQVDWDSKLKRETKLQVHMGLQRHAKRSKRRILWR